MLKWLKGNMPDITPAQLVAAFFGGLMPALTLVGVHLSPEQVNALDDLRTVGLGLLGADAAIRVGRNIGSRPLTAPSIVSQFGTTLRSDEDLDEPPLLDDERPEIGQTAPPLRPVPGEPEPVEPGPA